VRDTVRSALRREEDRGHAGAAGAADVRVDAVADHAGLVGGEAHPRHRQLEQRRLGLADHEGAAPRRGRHRLDDRPAAGQEVAVLHRELGIQVGRHELGARRDRARGRGEALVAEVEVVAHHDHRGLAVPVHRHEGVPAVDDRGLQLRPADREHARRPPLRREHLAEDLERGEDLAGLGGDAEALELVAHGRRARPGVVREEGDLATLLAQQREHLGGAGHEDVARPHAAVQVEHEALEGPDSPPAAHATPACFARISRGTRIAPAY
jgi:hypothetical protein